MALSIGTLVGYLGLDSSGFDDGLDQAEQGLGGFASKGKVVAAAAGAAIAVALGAALVSALNVDAANDRLAAQLGVSGETAKQAGKQAGDLYRANFTGSIEEAGAVVRKVVQNIGTDLNSPDFGPIAQKVAALVDVFEQDLGGTTAAVGQLIKTGMVADANEGLDLLTVGLQGPINKADDLMDTVTEYSTQFRQLGLSGADAFGLMQQAIQAGARDSDTVADALKEFAILAQESGGTASEAFVQLGLDGEQMGNAIARGGDGARYALDLTLDRLRGVRDPVLQAALGVQLFGTKSEDLQDALLALDLDTAAQGLGDIAGAAQQVADTAGTNTAGNLQTMGRILKGEVIDKGLIVVGVLDDITGALLATLGPALSTVSDLLSGLAGFLAENESAMIIVGGVIAGALLPPLISTATTLGSIVVIGIAQFLMTLRANAIAAGTAIKGLATAAGIATAGLTIVAALTVNALMGANDAANEARDSIKGIGDQPIDVTNIEQVTERIGSLQAKVDEYYASMVAAAQNGGFGELADAVNAYKAAAEEAEVQTQLLAEEQERVNGIVGELSTSLGVTREDLLALAEAAKVDIGKTPMEEARARILAYKDSLGAAKPGQREFEQANKDIASSATTAEEKVEAFAKQIDQLLNPLADVEEAADNYTTALLDMSETLVENGRKIEGNSRQALANRTAIRNAGEQLAKHLTTMKENGATQEELSRKWDAGVGALRRSFQQAGLNKQQIDKLVTSMGLVPPTKSTLFSTPGLAAAKSGIEGYIGDLRSVPKTISTRIIVNGINTLDGVINKLDNIDRNAFGTRNFRGGLSVVGEYGPEIVNLPRGTEIYPNGTKPDWLTAPPAPQIGTPTPTEGGMSDEWARALIASNQRIEAALARMPKDYQLAGRSGSGQGRFD